MEEGENKMRSSVVPFGEAGIGRSLTGFKTDEQREMTEGAQS